MYAEVVTYKFKENYCSELNPYDDDVDKDDENHI